MFSSGRFALTYRYGQIYTQPSRFSRSPPYAPCYQGTSLRQATLIDEYFHRQTEGIFEPLLMWNTWHSTLAGAAAGSMLLNQTCLRPISHLMTRIRGTIGLSPNVARFEFEPALPHF